MAEAIVYTTEGNCVVQILDRKKQLLIIVTMYTMARSHNEQVKDSRKSKQGQIRGHMC